LTNWSYIAGGNKFFIAKKTDGTLWAWGNNSSGELGINSASGAISSPVQIGTLTTWATVSAGSDFGIAIKTDGTAWSWGGNFFGQLGLNVSNTLTYSSPKQIGALTNWSTISGGYRSPSAIKTNKTLWSWGENSSGQLGIGSVYNYSSPKQVGSLTNWYSVSVGVESTYAISGP
jgi:alpha-tubulin suppressor-like RCC1 family protein